MNKLSVARRNKPKTSKLIDALQKDQMKRCSENMGGQSSSSGLLNPVLLVGRSRKYQRSDSDKQFLEGLFVLSPDSTDTLLLELMNQRSAGCFRVYQTSHRTRRR
jgi:hypothetical protein